MLLRMPSRSLELNARIRYVRDPQEVSGTKVLGQTATRLQLLAITRDYNACSTGNLPAVS